MEKLSVEMLIPLIKIMVLWLLMKEGLEIFLFTLHNTHQLFLGYSIIIVINIYCSF